DAGAEGADSFTYTITDGDGDTSTATVTLNIEADVNELPHSISNVVFLLENAAGETLEIKVEGWVDDDTDPTSPQALYDELEAMYSGYEVIDYVIKAGQNSYDSSGNLLPAGEPDWYDFTDVDETLLYSDLVDGIVEGVAYSTSSGIEGFTSEDGSFFYRPGDTVTFSIGSVVIGTVDAEAAVADGKVFLQEIAGVGLENLNDEYVENMAVFLQSLDSDGDAYNGIVITDAVHEAFSDESFDLASISEGDLRDTLLENGYQPVSEDEAMQHVKDMIVEHAGHTEFEERVSDGAVLLASEGDDVFAFDLAAASDTPADIRITGFGDSGNDALDLRDLLLGEEAEGADLTSYLKVDYDGANTVIEVSSSGGFEGNQGDAARVDQTITLEGVDLVMGNDDMASV
ncbi:MAG: type I secretion C-terminal target domain-containing protein, partial [Haliea sp.]